MSLPTEHSFSSTTVVLLVGSLLNAALAAITAIAGIVQTGGEQKCAGVESISSSELASLSLTLVYVISYAVIIIGILVAVCIQTCVSLQVGATSGIVLVASFLQVLFSNAWLMETIRNAFVCGNHAAHVLFWLVVVNIAFYVWIGVVELRNSG